MLFKTTDGTMRVDLIDEVNGVEYAYEADLGGGSYLFHDGTIFDQDLVKSAYEKAVAYAEQLAKEEE